MSAALILAIVSLTSIMQLRRDTDSFIGSGASTEGNVEGTAPAPVATSTAGSATKTPAPAKNLSLTYSDAINLFGGYRFQFTNCSGAPGTLNVTKGSTFLLDNRDDVAHTIKVGAQSYSLGAYGFRIATASTMGANQITCDGKGAAVVNVQ
jgi:hypothetical protein